MGARPFWNEGRWRRLEAGLSGESMKKPPLLSGRGPVAGVSNEVELPGDVFDGKAHHKTGNNRNNDVFNG